MAFVRSTLRRRVAPLVRNAVRYAVLVATAWLLLCGCTADDDVPSPGHDVVKDSGADSGDADSAAPVDTEDSGSDASADGGFDATVHPGDGGGPLTVGGTLSGLSTGATVVLQDNAGDNLKLTKNGPFTFATPLAVGATYAVTVLTPPALPAESCVVAHASGAVGAAPVTSVTVTCTSTSFTVGGTVIGLAGSGLVLQNTLPGGAEDTVSVTASGAFTFPTSVASGAPFSVSVQTQPHAPTQACTVSGGAGTIGGGDFAGVVVNCTADTYVISGTVTGLTGNGLSLADDNGETLKVSPGVGSFAFTVPIADARMYNVTVVTPPSMPTQACTVTGGSGTIMAANVSTVVVTCTTSAFTVGGMVKGLAAGDTLVLENEGKDDTTVAASGAFTFPTPVASGDDYAVTVHTQTGTVTQTCMVTKGSGTIAAANVTDVVVSCSTTSYTVGGTVSGLPANESVVLGNGADRVTVTMNGSFAFPVALAPNAEYGVGVITQPGAPVPETCSISGASGNVGTMNVTTVVVTCSSDFYVNVAIGSDSAATPGSAVAPWKTVTHAIATVSAGTIHVAAGTYNAASGETFPLAPRAHQTIVGTAGGNGAMPVLSGNGQYTIAGGGYGGQVFAPTLVVGPGITAVSVSGFVFDSAGGFPAAVVVIDGGTATLASNSVSNALVMADYFVVDGANVTMTSCSGTGGATGLLVADTATHVHARSSVFSSPQTAGVLVSGQTTGSQVDLGTSADPGGNTFTSSGNAYALWDESGAGVLVDGDTWNPGVQGADGAGHYAPMLVNGPAAGANYTLSIGTSVQF